MAAIPDFTHNYGNLDTEPVPYFPYYDDGFFKLEVDKVFRRNWLFAGRESDIPAAGDYVVKYFPPLKASLIIARQQDGSLKAFHNVCPHRANRVEIAECGHKNRFVCSFHGWSFGLDGALRHVPDEGAFFNLDRGARSLKAVPVDSWMGMLFVNFSAEPIEPLAAWLGELYGAFDGYPLPQMTTMLKIRTEVNANWKMVMDAFLEGYHVVQLHGQSAGDAFTSKENPWGHLNSVRLYDKHKSLSMYGNPGQTATAAAALELKYQQMATYAPIQGDRYDQAHGARWSDFPPGVNPDRRDDWAFDIHLLFPNCSFYTANGWSVTQCYWPVTAETSIVEATVYAFEPTSIAGYIGFEHTKAMIFDVALEDLSTVERAQSNLRSGAFDSMVLSDMEVVVRHSHYVIRDLLAQEA